MTERGPVVTPAAIAAFEAKLGAKLPDDYADFLLRRNGGQPPPSHSIFTVKLGSRVDSTSINSLNSLDDAEEQFNLEARWERARSWLPKETIQSDTTRSVARSCSSSTVRDAARSGSRMARIHAPKGRTRALIGSIAATCAGSPVPSANSCAGCGPTQTPDRSSSWPPWLDAAERFPRTLFRRPGLWPVALAREAARC